MTYPFPFKIFLSTFFILQELLLLQLLQLCLQVSQLFQLFALAAFGAFVFSY